MLENLRGVVTPRAIQMFLLGGVLAAAIVGGFSLLSSDGAPDSRATDVAGAPGTPRGGNTASAGRTPSASATSPAAVATALPATYTVKAGDSASLIASSLGVRDEDVTAWVSELGVLNNIDPAHLDVGQVLKLPPGGSNAAAAPTAGQAGTTGGGSSASPSPAGTSGPVGSSGSSSPGGTGATSQPGSTSTAAPAAATSTPAAGPSTQPTASSTAAVPANTATPAAEPSITVSPTRVTEGTVMTMTLRNFPPSSEVTVCFVVPDAGYQDCGSIDVDAKGYFSEPGSPLPPDIKDFPGTYRMEATGADGSFASASFEVY